MTDASKVNRRSFALIAGGLLACLTFGAGPAGADTPGGGEPPPAPPSSGGGALPESGSSTVTPDGQALGLAINVIHDPQPRPEGPLGKNGIPLVVTITENGKPTSRDYEVFAQAQNAQGDKTSVETCLERSYTSPTTARGIFWCTVIVDSPGDWTHSAFVNKIRKTQDEPPLNYGQAHVAIPCPEEEGCKLLESKGKVQGVSGDASTVAFLSLHTIFAATWFFCIALLVLLSLAAGRRALSERGAHYFESKLDRIVTGAKATTLAVAASGVYLMFRETAYDHPSTPDKVDGVFALEYGKPYFLSLWTKIGVYAVLIGFSVVIIKEARRRSTTVIATGGGRKSTRDVSADDIWGGDNWEKKSRGGTAVMVEEPQVIAEPQSEAETAPVLDEDTTHKSVRIAVLATAIGGVVIWFCVVLLKYFHQLIEAAGAITGTGS